MIYDVIEQDSKSIEFFAPNPSRYYRDKLRGTGRQSNREIENRKIKIAKISWHPSGKAERRYLRLLRSKQLSSLPLAPKGEQDSKTIEKLPLTPKGEQVSKAIEK